MRIGIIGRNSIEFIQILSNIWSKKDCAVIIDYQTPIYMIKQMLFETGTEKCFINSDLYQSIDFFSNSNIEFIPFAINSDIIEPLSKDIITVLDEFEGQEEAVIVFSSGTTGKAKGVIHSFDSLRKNAESIISYMHPTSKDCIFIVKSLSHLSTLVGELLVGIMSTMKIIICSQLISPFVALKNMCKYGATILCLNPTLIDIYSYVYSKHPEFHPTFNVLKIYISGSVLYKSLLEKVQTVFSNSRIYNVYGLSEAGPRVCAQVDHYNTDNSVGIPVKGVELKVVKDDGTIANCFEVGSIVIKTISCFLGYAIGSKNNLKNGWLDTGDLGYMNNNHELFIVGRNDDVIISNSKKVYPSSIENTIISIGYSDCFVFYYQNHIVALVKANDNKDVFDIRQKLKKYHCLYEIPDIIINVKTIPRNNNGKNDLLRAITLVEDYYKQYEHN